MTGCFHQKLNGTESQRTLNKQVAIRLLNTRVFSGSHSVNPTVGDFLDCCHSIQLSVHRLKPLKCPEGG